MKLLRDQQVSAGFQGDPTGDPCASDITGGLSMKKWFEPVSDLKKNINKGELSGSQFYKKLGLQRTRIKEEHFLQCLEVSSIASVFSQYYDHGATLTVSPSKRLVRKSFIIGPKDIVPNVSLSTTWAKIMLAAGLISKDGAGAVTNGKIWCLGKMMLPGKKYIQKALNLLGYGPSTHTRHTSALANSIRFRDTINIVTSHKGRCVLFLGGRLIGQITSFNGFGRSVYISPCNMPCLPKPHQEIRVKCNDDRIKQIISSSKSPEDIYLKGKYEIDKAQKKIQQQKAAVAYIRNGRIGAMRDIMNFKQFGEYFLSNDGGNIFYSPNANSGRKVPVPDHSIVHRRGVAVYNLTTNKRGDDLNSHNTKQYHLYENHYRKNDKKVRKPSRRECINNALRKRKKVRSLDEFGRKS